MANRYLRRVHFGKGVYELLYKSVQISKKDTTSYQKQGRELLQWGYESLTEKSMLCRKEVTSLSVGI